MKLLRTLTLAYVAILVPTLAASLIAILVYLRRIASALDQVGQALATASRETQPLNQHLDGLHGTSVQLADELVGVRDRLAPAPGLLTEALGADGAGRSG